MRKSELLKLEANHLLKKINEKDLKDSFKHKTGEKEKKLLQILVCLSRLEHWRKTSYKLIEDHHTQLKRSTLKCINAWVKFCFDPVPMCLGQARSFAISPTFLAVVNGDGRSETHQYIFKYILKYILKTTFYGKKFKHWSKRRISYQICRFYINVACDHSFWQYFDNSFRTVILTHPLYWQFLNTIIYLYKVNMCIEFGQLQSFILI